jgi:hypothetical protein
MAAVIGSSTVFEDGVNMPIRRDDDVPIPALIKKLPYGIRFAFDPIMTDPRKPRRPCAGSRAMPLEGETNE